MSPAKCIAYPARSPDGVRRALYTEESFAPDFQETLVLGQWEEPDLPMLFDKSESERQIQTPKNNDNQK